MDREKKRTPAIIILRQYDIALRDDGKKRWWCAVREIFPNVYGEPVASYDTRLMDSKTAALKEARRFAKWMGWRVRRIEER